ncbi:MAG: hypothetical protein U0Q16_22400 [Bryobacteraceae bacterium]
MPISVKPDNASSLSWSNFTPVDSLTEDEDAHIDFTYDLSNKPFKKVDGKWALDDTAVLTVKPVAKVKKSATQTDTLLSHEKGHFNLAILVGRALARDLDGLLEANPATLKTKATTAFDLHRLTRGKAVQKKYDDDTNHSLNTAQQLTWDTEIAKCLKTPSDKILNQPL